MEEGKNCLWEKAENRVEKSCLLCYTESRNKAVLFYR